MFAIRPLVVLASALLWLVPSTAAAQISFSFDVPDNSVVTDSLLHPTVSVCTPPSALRSASGTLVNSSGSSGVTMSDGPLPDCPGYVGWAWITDTDLVLKPGLNRLIVEVVDWSWTSHYDTLHVTYVLPTRARVLNTVPGGVRLYPSENRRLFFEVVNVGTVSDTFRLNLTTTGVAGAPYFVVVPKGQPSDTKLVGPLAPLARTTVEVGVGGPPQEGTGLIWVVIPGLWPDTAIVPVTVTRAPPPNATVTRARDTLKVAASTARSVAFTIRNPDHIAAREVVLSANCGGFTGCSVSPSTFLLPSASDSTVLVSFTVGATPPTTTWIKLTASVTSPTGSGKDSVLAHVTTVPSPSVVVDLASTNVGSAIARDQCLSVAAGSSAGIECGALRVAHGAPSVRTMGVERAPRLLYLSKHAEPLQLVNARVSIRDLITTDSLRTTLSIPSLSKTFTRWWKWSPECATSAGCRIVVPLAVDSAIVTGHYHYTLEVRVGAGGSPPTGQSTGTMIVVNDRQSVFGPGWWLEGLERLQGVGAQDSLLWIGGDGSARLYVKSATNDSVYLAQTPVARPDTLRKVGTRWARHLRNGARVWFSASFRHDSTVNRQGHLTVFNYSGSGPARLTSIRLPTPSAGAPNRDFTFTWDTVASPILLNSFRVPAQAGSGTRNSNVQRDAHRRIIRILDATSDSVRFSYATSPEHRLTRRINRLNDTTLYAYDAFGGVREVTVRMRTDTAIVTAICAAETRSLVTCSDGSAARPLGAARVNTFINGPRTDVLDYTQFFVNRFGAPDTVVNALGARTRAKRQNVSFPALVTELIDEAGLVTRSAYNSRGLPDSVTVVAPYGGSNAVTRFSWHAKWDMATRMQSPTGEIDSIGIDGSTGNRSWQKRGTHDSTKVHFSYDGLRRLVWARHGTDTIVRLEYDSSAANLGNVWRSRTALGYMTEFGQNAVGEINSISSPTDAAQTASLRTIQTLYRDVMGRITADTTTSADYVWSIREEIATLSDTARGTKAVVTTTYDAEGRPLNVQRKSLTRADTVQWSTTPFAATTATSSFTYDAAGRTKTQTTHGYASTSHYDAAGNPVRTVTKRGIEVRQTFDVLNRPTMRFTPTVTQLQGSCSVCSGDAEPFGYSVRVPYYATPIDGALVSPDIVIPAEVTVFAYDGAGRLIQADNAQAQIRRGYFPNGALKADTTMLRRSDPAASPQFGVVHRSILTYTYDLSGRRLTRGDALGGLQTYDYDALGQLDETTDRATAAGPTIGVTFGYDFAGRVRTQTAGGITAVWTYDSDGRVTTRTEGDFADTIYYDARGKRTKVIGRPLFSGAIDEVFTAAYDGLGHAIATSFSGGAWNTTDEMRLDGFGHTYTRYRNRGQPEDTESFDQNEYSSEHLTATVGVPRPFGATDAAGTGPAVKAYDELALTYDPSGNVTVQQSIRRAWSGIIAEGDVFLRAPTGHQWTWSTYDADERPRVVQQHRVLSAPSYPLTLQHEYVYDALGRRVVVRTRADSIACSAFQITDPEPCQQSITRTYWDSDQVFREDRQPGGWQSSAAALDYVGGGSAWYGSIRTVTAGAIDVPLIVWKGDAQALVLRRNWRGNVAGATQVAGTTLSYTPTWPAAITDIRYAPDAQLGSIPANSWWGSLALDQRDASGLLYRRNRYYDPQTGRFTQEDPIGLAGGMNLYGYGAGDPINNSDPFGLCVPFCPEVAAATITTGRALVQGAVVSARAIAPIAIAGAANVVAGTPFGARIGLPNSFAVGRHGNIQTRGADGQYLSANSNPGVGAALAANDGVQVALGIGKGVMHGLGEEGTPMPQGNTELQQRVIERTSFAVSAAKHVNWTALAEKAAILIEAIKR